MSPTSDNYTIHKVSLKRTRQACATCRRKKARCPGEKPNCSLCQRLGQRCTYETQAAPNRPGTQKPFSNSNSGHDMEGKYSDPASARRLQHIEQRLEEISSMLRSSAGSQASPADELSEALREYMPSRDDEDDENIGISPVTAPSTGHRDVMAHSPLSPPFIESEVRVYLDDFHDQPYCVFDKNWLLENASLLPSEVVFPLVALTRRLSVNSPGLPGRKISTGNYCAERAWRILSSQYRDGKTGLSFLQGTFLIAQLDFADGNAHRGCNSVALGLRLIQSAGLNRGQNLSLLSKSEGEATRRIIWAYFMLDRTYNASRNYSLCLSDNHFILSFPSSNGFSRGSLHKKAIKAGQKDDQSIIACLIKLYSLWGKATEWVFEPMVSSNLPPWQTGSALSIIESEWMDFETEFADIHRYINVDFRRRAREDPKSRPYLSTWLCVQFLFHGIQCLLHHPFVTMIKLREMSGNLSATFLQKSFESSLLHSRWIARFIREISDVDLRLCDPFFGYLAAIAATIQVEHTGNKNPQIALLVNSEYRVLVGFITELSSQWETMKILVNRVNTLASRRQNQGSLFYNQDGYSGALSTTTPTPSNLPRMSVEDEALMWDILDLTSSSDSPVAAGVVDIVSEYGEETTAATEISAPPTHATTEQIAQGQKSNNQITSKSILGGIPQLTEATSTPQWPFVKNGNLGSGAAGVPDIPDWMLFGDFMTDHL